MKVAVVVVGAESTGTRMLTQMIIDQGFFGDAEDPQRVLQILNASEPLEEPYVVVRRSVPHGEVWDGLSGLMWSLYERGYSLKVIVTVRDPYCICMSQAANQKHAFNVNHALRKIMRAYVNILPELSSYDAVPYVILPYESLILSKGAALKKVFMLFNLPYEDKMYDVRDENRKWYETVS
ncbi:MAG: hypothetical protein QXT73_01180 [Candidatus Methanomethylicaceae archaeon]